MLNDVLFAIRDELRASIDAMLTKIETEQSDLSASDLERPDSSNIFIGYRTSICDGVAIYIEPEMTIELEEHRQWTDRHAGFQTYDHLIWTTVHLHGDKSSEETSILHNNYYLWAIQRVLEEKFPESGSGDIFNFRFGSIEHKSPFRPDSNDTKKLTKRAQMSFVLHERIGIGTTNPT